MAGGAESTSSAKRAKLRKKKKRDALERKKNDLFLRIEKAKELVREAEEYLAKHMPSVCDDLEDENHDELMGQLPAELWEKIVDEYVQQNDLLALAMTCRFFRDTTKDLGKKLETDLTTDRLRELRKSGNMSSHTLGWFQWVCDTFEVQPGWMLFTDYGRVKGGVMEGNLVNYAAHQGSVEILRLLLEEKGYELNEFTSPWFVGQGDAVKILEYLVDYTKGVFASKLVGGRVYELSGDTCTRAAGLGYLEALKFLRGLNPPCPWERYTCEGAASEGHLEVLKWLRDQDPPCPWSTRDCRHAARSGGHQHIVKWINQREEDETDVEYSSDDDIRYW